MPNLRRYQAREEVVRAVLKCQLADLVPPQASLEPRARVAVINAAYDELELASRNLARAVEQSEPQSWPAGWGTAPIS